MKPEVLVSWIGRTDLRVAIADGSAEQGPIAQAVAERQYSAIHLICDFPERDAKRYIKWLTNKTRSVIHLHSVTLSSPINFGEIYKCVVRVLSEIDQSQHQLTYHLSPGTPAMQSIWILLAKTTHPARLIQSSPEAGVEEANIPFDISAEFIPQLLERSDRKIADLVQGHADSDAEFGDIVHRGPVMRRVIEGAKRMAVRSVPVLIEGESGTGKELLARAIHQASPRRAKAFVAVNCGAIPPELVESEFFGHAKGAFTGAGERKGHFEIASGGTLFLDEVGELPLAVQVKLLRVLQEGEVTPIGHSIARKVAVRVIAATNRTLITEVANGRFREDLFYRLAVGIVKLPPLRDRPGDVGLLIDTLLAQVNQSAEELGLNSKKLSASAKHFMLQHTWPGNIRELLNTLHRAAIWTDEDVIGLETVKEAILVPPQTREKNASLLDRPIEGGVPLEELMASLAKHYIERAMQHTHNNKTKAAELLHLGSYQTLSYWMEKYGLKA